MVARMNASHKNHAGFLRVASEIHKAMPDVEFVLVGDGSLRPEIERQAVALGLRECTTCHHLFEYRGCFEVSTRCNRR
jgi:glycosyltransferase involved in cell wall biosynthesis